ncbi:MAG: hypothetical protein K1X89_28375 [Myxococcaceae bacterium]|nr:hypothetical protein [Myxococcaceae bacterium]
MQEYLLKVSPGAAKDVARYLDLPTPPTHVRLSTLAPLSSWGYPPDATGAVLKILEHGLVTGQDGGRDEAPHDFVPWQNVAYLSDGTRLAKETLGAK